MNLSVVESFRRITIAGALLAWVTLGYVPVSSGAQPELRERIERLQAEADLGVDSREVLLERLETLWDWYNELSTKGRALPADLPLIAYDHLLVLRGLGGAEPEPEAAATISSFVARHTRELAALEADPGAAGTLDLQVAGPLRVADHVTFVQVYAVGPHGMQIGGGLILVPRRSGRLQGRDPAGEGYVTVRASRPRADLVLSPRWGEWENFFYRGTLPFRLAGADLVPGDTVTVTYGDRSGGSPGHRVQSHSNDAAVFPVLVDLHGRGEPWSPELPSVEVVGGEEIAYVNALAPSVVGVGEAFELRVRSEDRFKNLSSGPTPAYQILLDGETWHTLPAGGPAVAMVEVPGMRGARVARFEVRSADGELRGWSNPVAVRREPGQRVFWGDLHGHTGLAEGQGTVDGYYRFGRDVAGLDFLCLSEHDALMDDAEWGTLEAAVARYRREGSFTPLLGYEWTQYNSAGGHHNVYFADAENRARVPVQETVDQADFYRRLLLENEPDDVLVVPHAHESADWNQSDPAIERLVEMQSGHGTFEYFGSRYLAQGWRVGFVGASDNHAGHPGYTGITSIQQGGLTAVLAPANTAVGIFSGLRSRATYATTGERILLDASLNGGDMGRRLPWAAERHLRCEVHGTAALERIDVVKNGSVIYTRHFLANRLDHTALVQLSLESSSEVFSGPRNPRGQRPWRVTLDVQGARLTGVKLPWFSDPTKFRVERSDGDSNHLELTLGTRGRAKAVLLTLEEASPGTIVDLSWAQGRERPPRPGATPDRPPAELPPDSFRVPLRALVNGPARKEMTVGLNVDAVQLRLIPADAPLDADFEFRETDTSPADYYYLRVAQVDGAMAWSSPWWIGEDQGGQAAVKR